MNKRPASGYLLAGVATFAIGGTHAAAQTTTDTAAATLGEVVVTAQRREERLVDVPISVIAKSSEELQEAGVKSMTDIAKLAPGVNVTRLGAYSQPTIRGVSTKANSIGLDANVATYVDGFYQSNPMAINRSLADVESIQVLRGPQGALYGRNATGGAFIINTRKPTHTPTLDISGELEKFDGRAINAFGSIGVTENLAIGYTTHWGESDGWLRNVGPAGFNFAAAPRKSRNNRLRLLFEPTDKFDLLLTLEEGFNQDGTALPFSYYAHPAPTTLLTDPKSFTSSASGPQIVSALWRGAYLTATADLGFATLTSYSQYRKDRGIWRFDLDGTYLPANPNTVLRMPQRTMSQEFTLTSNGDGPLTWTAGASYLNDRTSQEFYFPPFLHPRIDTKALAAYVDATYAISDQLFVTLGGRYSQEKKHCQAGLNSTGPLSDCTGGDPRRTDNAFTPRAVVRYEIDRNTSLYGSYSQGFKTGGYNTGSARGQLRPEKIDAFEMGAKTVRGPFTAEIAAFHYDYRDLQFGIACPVVAPPVCVTTGTVVTNAAASKIYGAEGQFAARLNENLRLSAAISYLHARYRNFTAASAAAPRTSGSGCTLANQDLCPNVTVAQNWSGTQMIRSPDWSGNMGLDYAAPTSFGIIAVNASVFATSKFQTHTNSLPCVTNGCGAGLKPRLSVPGYATVAAAVSWQSLDKTYKATLYARNLFDKYYLLATDGSTVGDYAVGGEPRVIGVRLDYSY